MRIEIPLVGGHYKRKELKIDAQECINLYPVIDQSGGRFASLHPVPGLKEWVDTAEAQETRALFKFSDTVLYAVIGKTVYKVENDGSYTALAATLDNGAGPLQIITNGVQAMLLDLTDGLAYVIESDVVTQVADVDFPVGSSLAYQDGYAIVSRKNSKKFYISTLDTTSLAAYNASDFTRWEALDFTRAEGINGNILAIISDHDELWAMGSEQTGFYYNSGNADFPFTKTQHPFQECGLGGTPASIVSLDNSLFWIDAWNNVRKAEGYTPIIVSTPEISSIIEEYSTFSDAIAFGYRYAGQAFYCITFPTADQTYCYDVSTGIWHVRSSGMDGNRWRANCYAYFAGKHLLGDYEDGIIYEFDPELYTDAGNTFPATRTTRYTDAQRRTVFYSRLELHIKAGVGNVVSPGDDPQVMLQWSDDGGENWSNEKWAHMGKIGETTYRVVWRKLGRARERIFKFKITDPVNRILIALYADVTIGRD